MLRRAVWRPWLFLLPFATGAALHGAGPMIMSLMLSFTLPGQDHDANGARFGEDNYRLLLGLHANGAGGANGASLQARTADRNLFLAALSNSLLYTLMAVPAGLASSLAVACLLNRSMRGMGVVRTIVYLPYVLGSVASLFIWSWLLNPRFGGVNAAIRVVYRAIDAPLTWIGVEGARHWPAPDWLYSPAWCKPALALMHVASIGGSSLVFLAALRRVPVSLIDAAMLDGASTGRRWRCVVLPLLRPVVAFNAVTQVVFAMQMFSESFLLSNRAQNDGLLFVTVYVYQLAFDPPHQVGPACAASWLLAGVVGLLIAPILAWGVRGRGLLHEP